MFHELRHYVVRTGDATEFLSGVEELLLPALHDAGFALVGSWTIDVGAGGAGDYLWLLEWAGHQERDAAYERVRADDRNIAFHASYVPMLVSTSTTFLKPAFNQS